ncbi:UDP-glucose--hexose-1-phosphate uridylyltransferase [Lactobacillus xylocopicola]|uniref:Galactose-1-phosphate uridylyltransferase n=1 Tax=Lactobacillus xylocopicola TaxID=2976676 RepID=A0ABM8BHS6_9LACO|nr:UDP-glucose--hexose-1-phosphate uridylyltransferase [Lactobacillus xylocopicola]BDR60847.1 galactose-1-phosphate uridylyltransferase [Lactobacillus xylocopicola]
MAESNLVEKFITQVIANSDYEDLDRIYLRNRVLALVGDSARAVTTSSQKLLDLQVELVNATQDNGSCQQGSAARDRVATQLMELIVPRPSKVNRDFWQTYQESPERAIADFYQLSIRSDYIKTQAIAKNIYFTATTKYGDLEITINLSKPEKDPKEIAAARDAKQAGYPLCQLCMENEGYLGRLNYPARRNHRIIRFRLNDQVWGFQYSPYAYFNEHCIFLSAKHEKMHIGRRTFSSLLDIIAQFPGYFAGSNADLPIVGGSILAHEHYQGGRHQFAMEQAPVTTKLHFAGFDQVQAGIVDWPLAVIRLRARDQAQLVNLATKITTVWREYDDERVAVRATTNGVQHHTVTPIARRRGHDFELDLVLRDNQTSPAYPDGIFHPHPDVQHIKKENIGLIEVMGLAILPPRLKPELEEVKKFLLDEPNQVAPMHLPWAQQIRARQRINADNVDQILRAELGQIFARVLEDAGVFKRTQAGQTAFMRFVQKVGLAEQSASPSDD